MNKSKVNEGIIAQINKYGKSFPTKPLTRKMFDEIAKKLKKEKRPTEYPPD